MITNGKTLGVCYITSPHVKGVRDQHYFSMRPSVRTSVVRPSVRQAISS